jgi:RNA polymerase sigma-70 factor, ECF subfamily
MHTITNVSCSDLLGRVAGGDRIAFRALYDTVGKRLFAICLRMMRSKTEAEDVLQDAFVKIWEKSWQFDPAKGDGMAWLATVTRHTALDRLRAPRRVQLTIDDETTAEIDRAMSVSPVNFADHHDLDRCMSGLRDDYRKAITLAYVRGMTHEELAESLGKPLGTIKSWISRGLAQLKDCMSI